jgi:hypothetical protein
MSPPVAPSDDPYGGRPLTQRLKRVLPIAFVIGLAVGIPLSVVASDWRPAVAVPLAAAALAGTLTAAVEDGRVQRRVDASMGESTRTGLRAAAQAARAGDDARVRSEVERALLRGATPGRVVREIDDPRWGEERVAEVARALGEPGVSPPPPPDASP